MHFRIWRKERGASNSDSVSYSVIQELSGNHKLNRKRQAK